MSREVGEEEERKSCTEEEKQRVNRFDLICSAIVSLGLQTVWSYSELLQHSYITSSPFFWLWLNQASLSASVRASSVERASISIRALRLHESLNLFPQSERERWSERNWVGDTDALRRYFRSFVRDEAG